ncbi:MAG: 3-oxocholest-4-en-26-oyl-CoA dehydrogenase alpha subunit [Solirubrobacteraceae bacterium]|nr:3-oxocholest-4-en-26-oyl-CoA dehydrogenase alpha subunit [Solirubrobacteraceae bacterium]
MYVGYDEEQEALRQELRSYYAKLLTPEVREKLAHSGGVGPEMRKVWKQMCADGWSGVGWPTEYGGQARSAIEQFVFFDESMRAGAPVPMLSLNTVGPTIMNFGTQEQKDYFLPKILKGELHFCIGYSEPEAGTDLANLKCRADIDGDELIINGQKLWTSLASDADWCWLAVRTNQEAKKHKGISMVLVPLKDENGNRTPGIEVSPLHLLGEHDINAVFYTDVRVPIANVVGGIDQGWNLITNQLNHERVTLCSSGVLERMLYGVLEWAQQTKLGDGRRVVDQEWVQMTFARVKANLEFLKLINWKVAWTATQGHLDIADASSIKVFGTEYYMTAIRLLGDILGESAYLPEGSPGAVLKGQLEANYRGLVILTFGGGVNEVQRDLISIFGLGMPRSMR